MKQYSTYNSHAGFTLVELSIVLIIIGLIVAGVTGGQSLIKSFEIRSAISELNQIKIAINLFEDKYDAIPGDMKNATAYWPGVTSDGDGNSHLTYGDSPIDVEGGYLWHHLGLSGIYKSFSRPNAANFSYEYGINTPEILPYTAAVGEYRTIGGVNTSRYYTTQNYIQVGGWSNPGSASWIRCPVADLMTALSIDKKMDDGVPSSGIVLAYVGTGCPGALPTTCTDGGGNDYYQPAGTVDYDLSRPDGKCRMAFLLFND